MQPSRPVTADETNAIEIASIEHEGPVDFTKEVLPILQRNCLACHNSTDAESDLILETPMTILKGGSEGPAAVAGNGAQSRMLQVAARQTEPFMPPPDNDVRAKSLTPSELGLIKLWIDQGATGEGKQYDKVVLERLPLGVNPILAVDISPDGQFVAAGQANQIVVYQVPTKREVARLTDPELLESGIYQNVGAAHWDLVQSLAFSPDNQILASGGYRTAKLWRINRNVQKAQVSGLEGPPQSFALSRNGKLAAVGEQNGTIKIVDLAVGKITKTLAGHSAAVTSVCFSADGLTLVSGSRDRQLRLWRIPDGNPRGEPMKTMAPIHAVECLSDDQLIATGHADSVVRLWRSLDAERPQEPDKDNAQAKREPELIREFKGHGGPISSLAGSFGDGTQLLSGSLDSTARLWDIATGSLVRQLNHGGPVVCVAARPDGQRFATASSNNTTRLWNANDPKPLAELKGDVRATRRVGHALRAVALAKRKVADAKKDLLEAKNRKKAEEDDAKKTEEARKKAEDEFDGKSKAAKQLLADQQAAHLELEANQAALAEAETSKNAAQAAAKQAAEAWKHAQAALAVAEAKDETEIAVARANDEKQAADAFQQQAEQELVQIQVKVKQSAAKVKQLAGSAQQAIDEKNMAQRTLDAARRTAERSAIIVQKASEVIPGFEAAVAQLDAEHQVAAEVLDETKESALQWVKSCRAVAFSPDGTFLATAGDDQVVRNWDADTGAAVEPFEGHRAAVTHLGFAENGCLVSTADDASMIVWATDPHWTLQHVIGSIDSHQLDDRVTALAFSPDATRLATGSGEPSRMGQLKIWNVEDGSLVREIDQPHSDSVFGLEFSPDGQHIASCGGDRMVKVFRVADGKLEKSFEGHTHHVLGLSWRADGRVLASSGADQVVKVWDFRTGQQLRTITGFGKEVTSVRFLVSPDGNQISNVVASCGDTTIYTKNSDNGDNGPTFRGSTDFVYCVAASQDSSTIAAGGHDGVLRIWNNNGQLQATFGATKKR